MGLLFEALAANSISLAFAIGIGVIFLLATVSAVAARWGPEHLRNRLHRFVQAAPGLMTAIGVLGTFLGILYGLFDFDVSNIDRSVPSLLEGMKVAFTTSVLGMGAAVLFRIIEALGRALFGSRVLQDGGDDPMAQLEAIRKGIAQQTAWLAGNNEGSVLGTLKHARLENSEAFRSLNLVVRNGFEGQTVAFRDFAEHMKENTSKALIEALEGVIRDFNTKLTEQFGENFKQLNAAVGQLVAWQDKYRGHVEKLEARHQAAVMAIEKIRDSLVQISGSMATLPESAQA